MALSVKSGGVWRVPNTVWVKAGGIWRNCTSVSVKSGGVWRTVFSRGNSAALTNHTVNNGSQTVTVGFQNDGTLFIDSSLPATIAGEWLTSSPGPVTTTTAGQYDVFFTYVSGPNLQSGTTNTGGARKSGDAYATWLNLATTRSISCSAFAGIITGNGAGTLVFTAAIRPAGGGVTLATATFTITAAI